MKKNISVIIITFVSVFLFADGSEPIGAGTEAEPYQIETLDNLLWVSTTLASWDKHFIQATNIDASETDDWHDGFGFSPIGLGNNDLTAFSGNYDGQNHTVTGLTINRSIENSVGMFGNINNAIIENLGLEGVDIRGGEYVGGLVGNNNNSTINNCYSTGEIEGHDCVGGLVGNSNDSTINNCYSTAEVDGDYGMIGGLSGMNVDSGFFDCYSTGEVNGEYGVGGFIGGLMYGTETNNCYSTGDVSGDFYVGGFAGSFAGNATMTNCYSLSDIQHSNDEEAFVGGLVGQYFAVGFMSDSTIINSFYNYEIVTIEQEHIITVGALGNEQFELWITNGMALNIDDYFAESDSVYLVSSVEDLTNLLGFCNVPEYSFKQTTEIDLIDNPGFYIPGFSGSYNGDGYSIDNLNLEDNSYFNYQGMFGSLQNATVENLQITNVNVSGDIYIGGLAGSADESTILNCSVTGNVQGDFKVGGFVGAEEDNDIDNCSYSGNVQGTHTVGGLIGEGQSSVSNCYATGTVHGDYDVGGLMGTQESWITMCWFDGSVQGHSSVGGLIGSGGFTTAIINCYSVGNVLASGSNIGGLVGEGSSNLHVRNCYSKCTVTGSFRVAGLIGDFHEGTVENCYSVGEVVGEISTGGLIAYVSGDSMHVFDENNFWNTDTSNQTESAFGTGKTTSEMLDIETYTNTSTEGLEDAWDFVDNPFNDNENDDYWDIDTDDNEGYPFLADLPLVESSNEDIPHSTESIHLKNYPNPFNPTTTISFNISSKDAMSAELKIYNIKGQLVKRFSADNSSEFSKGSVLWNGKDSSNKSVSSGVYFYKLDVNNKILVSKKMILLK
jgi:hypothetical protein